VVAFPLLAAIPLAPFFPVTLVPTIHPSARVDVWAAVIAAATIRRRVGIIAMLRTSNAGD